jgi:HD-like signal output (HDOD) protein
LILDKRNTVPFPVAKLNLPPFPQVALKVLKLTQSDDVQLSQLEKLILTDAAFASEVLMIANSYLYASRYPVKDLKQACATLGMQALNGVCLTVGVRTYLGKTLNDPAMRCLWQHNLATALIGEQMAKGGIVNAGVAYTAGILHDVGRICLGVIYPKDYGQLLFSYKGDPSTMLDREVADFGVDHCEIGESVISEWELPSLYFEAVSDHHSARNPDGRWTIGELVKIACRLADTTGFPAFPGCETTAYDDLICLMPGRERRNLPVTCDELRSDVSTRMSEIAI